MKVGLKEMKKAYKHVNIDKIEVSALFFFLIVVSLAP